MSYPNYYPTDYGYHVIGWFREGRYYAVPKPEVIKAFLTICARAKEKYNVGIAAWALMSSHPHIFVFDLDPTKPSQVWKFKQFVHGVFAQWLNWHWGLSGAVFDKNVVAQQFAILDLAEEQHQIAYIECNMIAAGILDQNEELAGAVSKRDYLHTPLVIERPKEWFQKRTWPAFATLQLDVPPMAQAEGLDRDAWWWKSTVHGYVAQMHAYEAVLRSGKKLRTPHEVRNEDPHSPRKVKVSHGRIPCASKDKEKRRRFNQLRSQFRRLHKRARERLASGILDVIFPWGTCRMTCIYGYPMNAGAG